MRARLFIAVVCVMLIVSTRSWANEIDDGSGAGAPAAVAAVAVVVTPGFETPVNPWIHPKMPERVRTTLEAGFDLAVQRVREVESCSDLFAQLGADGLETLSTGLYFPVDSHRREVEVCGRNSAASSRGAENLAYTKVGDAPTWICRHFGRVSPETAAVAVIHEALHHAGLTEKPHDRTAMTSIQITRMVQDACGLTGLHQAAGGRLPETRGAANTSSTARAPSTGGLFIPSNPAPVSTKTLGLTSTPSYTEAKTAAPQSGP